MNSLSIAGIVFACILIGTLVGMLIARVLPAHHLAADSKESVKQGLALIATLTALVLGLLVATTKGTYDTQSAAIKEIAANVALLDRILGKYGPETKEVRESLKEGTRMMLEQTWPNANGEPTILTTADLQFNGDLLFDRLTALQPKNEAQQLLKTRALEIAISVAQTRLRLSAQKESSIPLPFLLVLGFWLTILFTSYGMLAPRNATVISVLVVCMLSVSGALFLILEMDKPFDGVIRVPSAPLREVSANLGK